MLFMGHLAFFSPSWKCSLFISCHTSQCVLASFQVLIGHIWLVAMVPIGHHRAVLNGVASLGSTEWCGIAGQYWMLWGHRLLFSLSHCRREVPDHILGFRCLSIKALSTCVPPQFGSSFCFYPPAPNLWTTEKNPKQKDLRCQESKQELSHATGLTKGSPTCFPKSWRLAYFRGFKEILSAKYHLPDWSVSETPL